MAPKLAVRGPPGRSETAGRGGAGHPEPRGGGGPRAGAGVVALVLVVSLDQQDDRQDRQDREDRADHRHEEVPVVAHAGRYPASARPPGWRASPEVSRATGSGTVLAGEAHRPGPVPG